MKEVRLIPWCDGHDDEKVEAVIERTITIDGCKPVLLDLCDLCDKNVIVVAELLSRGVLAEKPKRKPKAKPKGDLLTPADVDSQTTTACPRCGHNSPTRSALGAHTRTKHGMGLREVFAQ